MNLNYLENSTDNICLDNKKSSWDLSRLTVTQTHLKKNICLNRCKKNSQRENDKQEWFYWKTDFLISRYYVNVFLYVEINMLNNCAQKYKNKKCCKEKQWKIAP